MSRISHVRFTEQREAIRFIRHRVFTLEQGVDPAVDFDGQDGNAWHVLAYYRNKPVGTGRMLDDGHIGRVAVLPDYRGRGLGRGIILALADKARELGLAGVELGAQARAVPFYEKLGFRRDGEDFVEANILHTPMTLEFNT